MKKLIAIVFTSVLVFAQGCTKEQLTKAEQTVYDMRADQFACVLVANLTSEDDVMKFCQLEERLRPQVHQVFVGKAAARHAEEAAAAAHKGQ
jgi:hypothetical protein